MYDRISAQKQLTFTENGTRCATVTILSTCKQFSIEGTKVFHLELEDTNSSATCIILESRELAKKKYTTSEANVEHFVNKFKLC